MMLNNDDSLRKEIKHLLSNNNISVIKKRAFMASANEYGDMVDKLIEHGEVRNKIHYHLSEAIQLIYKALESQQSQ